MAHNHGYPDCTRVRVALVRSTVPHERCAIVYPEGGPLANRVPRIQVLLSLRRDAGPLSSV